MHKGWKTCEYTCPILFPPSLAVLPFADAAILNWKFKALSICWWDHLIWIGQTEILGKKIRKRYFHMASGIHIFSYFHFEIFYYSFFLGCVDTFVPVEISGGWMILPSGKDTFLQLLFQANNTLCSRCPVLFWSVNMNAILHSIIWL